MSTDPLLKWARRGLIAGGIFCMAIGGGSFFWLHQSVATARQWPMAEGQVVEARVEDLWARGSQSRGSSSDTRYVPVIVYAYQADGQLHQSDRIWRSEYRGWGSQGRVQAFVGNYPVGTRVPVHLNPSDPADAALLIPDAPWWPLVFVPLGILIAGLGWMIPRLFGRMEMPGAAAGLRAQFQARHGPRSD